MPYAFFIDPQRRLVITRMYGVLAPQDAAGWQREVTSDERFDPGFDHLCSFENVTEARLEVPGVQLASALSPFSAHSRRAFVMPSDELYGLGRAFQLFLGHSEEQHRLFRDRASAMAWLQLDAEAVAFLDESSDAG